MIRVGGITNAAPVAWTKAVQWSRMGTVSVLGFGIALAVAQATNLVPWAQDAHVYYTAQPGNLYPESWQWSDAPYGYSPAFADALAPFRLLPERVFMGLWQLLLVAALAVTLRGWAVVILALDVVLLATTPNSIALADIAMGNIHVLLGACAVWGLRYPALWAFPLLSKVTPGIGLLWFVARGEWRNLAIALGVTAIIAGISFALIPADWFAWVGFLRNGDTTAFPLWVVPVPLWARLSMSAALIVWGARTDRAWVLPVACLWAIPIPYPTMIAGMVFSLGAARGVRESAPSPR